MQSSTENTNANGEEIGNDGQNESNNDNEGNPLESIKTIAEGMFDLALLSSNANQLVHLMNNKNTTGNKDLRTTTIVLLIVSIVLQVIVGGLLISLITLERRRTVPERTKLVDKKQTTSNPRRILNTTATILIFFITVLNVLIPSLHPTAEQQECENQGLKKMSEVQNRGGYWDGRDHF